MKTGIKLSLRNFFDRFSKTSYRQDLQAILKFLKVTGCYYVVVIMLYLTNRFHFAVRLYSDNAQMTSKRGENKEVRYEPQASSVTDVLTTF